MSRALKMAYGRSVSTFGVRFHPAKGAAFLGQRATKLQDTLLPVADRDLKARGVTFESEPDVMPFGTGVMMQDLYGNKSYLNQDAA